MNLLCESVMLGAKEIFMGKNTMHHTDTTAKDIERLIAQVHKAGTNTPSPLLKKFTHLLYADAPLSTLQEKGAKTLNAIAHTIWSAFEKNHSGKAYINIANPNQKTFDWQTQRTIVTVIHKDSPFLVDSIVSYLTQSGYHVDSTIHPVLGVKRDGKNHVEALEPETHPRMVTPAKPLFTSN